MVVATSSRAAQFSAPQAVSQFSVQGVTIANAALAYSFAEYALFEASAALYVLATGKPDPRKAANSASKAIMQPYTEPQEKAFADGLLKKMQDYPDASKMPKGKEFVASLKTWKAAAYKANEPNSSLQIFAGLYIEDQKLLTKLRGLQANPKVSIAQREKAQNYVLTAKKRPWSEEFMFVRSIFLTANYKEKPKPPKKPEPPKKKFTPENRSERRRKFYADRSDRIARQEGELYRALEAFKRLNNTWYHPALNGTYSNPLKPFQLKGTLGEKVPTGFIKTADGKLFFNPVNIHSDRLTTIDKCFAKFIETTELREALKAFGLLK